MDQNNLLPRQINFYEKLDKIFDSKYEVETKNKRRYAKNFCKKGSKDVTEKLFPQQQFVTNILQKNGIRGMQIFHGLGSGKTCASISSAISILKSGNFDKVIIFLPAFLKDNFESEIESCKPQGAFLSADSYEIFAYNSNSLRNNLYKSFGVTNLKDLIEKMENKIIIVDESHHLIQMMHNQLIFLEKRKIDNINFELAEQSNGLFFYKLFMSLKNVKIILLSGTPLTNFSYEAAVLGNILVGYTKKKKTLFPENSSVFYNRYLDEYKQKLKNLNDFERRFIGLISYYPSIDNKYIFPVISDYYSFVLQMLDDQRSIYEYYYNLEKEEEKKRLKSKSKFTEDIPGTFMVFTRMASNFVYPIEYFEKFRNYFYPVDLKDITLADFLNFKELNKKKPSIGEEEYKKIFKQFTQNFNQVYPYYFGKYKQFTGEDGKIYRTFYGVENCSCKYEQLKKQLLENLGYENTELENVPKKTLIYSNFKNWAGLQSLEYLLKYMGFRRDKDLNPEINYTNQLFTEKDSNEKDSNNGLQNTDSDENMQNYSIRGGSGKRAGAGAGASSSRKEISPEIANLMPDSKSYSTSEYKKYNDYFKGKKYLIFEGKNKKEIIAKFNDQSNDLGQIYPILIISGSGAEGISLTNTRFVHIMEPYWNKNRIDQVIGRATRLCSHYTLEEQYQNVTVYEYLATIKPVSSTTEIVETGPIETTDLKIDKISKQKYEIIKGIYNIFKVVAVDCRFMNSKRCTEYRYDMSTYNPKKMSKYWYDYYYKNKQEFNDISKFITEYLTTLYKFKNSDTTYLGKDIDENYYIINFNKKYFEILGIILNDNDNKELFIVYDFNENPLYKLKKNDVEAGEFMPILEQI
jgi:ATP:corrinoid adenosyltransferase